MFSMLIGWSPRKSSWFRGWFFQGVKLPGRSKGVFYKKRWNRVSHGTCCFPLSLDTFRSLNLLQCLFLHLFLVFCMSQHPQHLLASKGRLCACTRRWRRPWRQRETWMPTFTTFKRRLVKMLYLKLWIASDEVVNVFNIISMIYVYMQ